ncbi:nuclear nucleic acid-binding protein C1D-like, partial [Coregonus clupeaformis]|uniref:nuclear nucleic acid-binding protein C1D-like n=1 Tax=Coregonus clupeaformis TaxID=59861 RepID=UPI001E1C9DC3
MAEDIPVEDYPTEIEEQLTGFEQGRCSSVDAVNNMVQTIISMPRNELVQRLDPLEQAKLDLTSAYSLNSLFWTYLVTQGINPKQSSKS